MEMKAYYKQTLQTLYKAKIKYIVGAESLVGLSEGDLFKYSSNLKLYIYPISIFKFIYLFILLLRNNIIIKPKIENKHLLFKLRHKKNIFTKDKSWIKFLVIKSNNQKSYVSIGNKKTYFLSRELTAKISSDKLHTPISMETFIKKYKKNLLSDFYINYEINFNSNDEQKAINTLFDVKNILNHQLIDYWIEGGTLLGAIRDKKLIPWDHDIDMGIINNSDKQIEDLIKRLKKDFYVSVKGFDKNENIWNLGKYRVLKVYPKKKIFFKDKLCLDIFIYYLGNIPNIKEKVYKYVVWGKNGFHKRKFFDQTEQIKFYNDTINIPSNSTDFLEIKYGSDWKIPNKEWNVALDDGSIIR